MANEVYAIVFEWPDYSQNYTYGKIPRQTKGFFTEGVLKHIGMDILRPLPRTKENNYIVVVSTDRYSELTKAIPDFKKISQQSVTPPWSTMWGITVFRPT